MLSHYIKTYRDTSIQHGYKITIYVQHLFWRKFRRHSRILLWQSRLPRSWRVQKRSSYSCHYSSFESLLLLVLEKVRLVNKYLTPNFPKFWIFKKISVFRKVAVINFLFWIWILNIRMHRKSLKLLCRMYAVSWTLTKRRHLEIAHFSLFRPLFFIFVWASCTFYL